MPTLASQTTDTKHLFDLPPSVEGRLPESSAVSWSAIFAGAVAAAALSLILLFLGSGLGFGAVSPWTSQGIGTATLAISAIAWLTFTQLAASALGGYLAGRLRNRWLATHSDEVYFRDTAHGLLSWAVATLLAAGLLTTAVGSIVSAGAQLGTTAIAAATVTSAVATKEESDRDEGGMAYLIDTLFRKEAAANNASVLPTGEAAHTAVLEATRIFVYANRMRNLPVQDVQYLGQIVSQRTGVPLVDAEKRVNEAFSKLQANLTNAKTLATEAADKARKASAYAALWLFISLLAGAFIASVGATLGGRQRDL